MPAAFDIKTGNVIAKCGDTRTVEDLPALVKEVAKVYTDDKKIHFTPKHASWINRIEIFFSILHRRCLKLSSFKSKEELKQMVIKFIKLWNDKEGHAFNWAFKGYPMQSVEKEIA